jgi:hypothetical protein
MVLEDRFATLHSRIAPMVLEDRFATLHSKIAPMVLEDRSLHSLEDRFASATLEDCSLTLTRRTSRHSVPIFKGSARSSNEVIFQPKAIYRLRPIFKQSDLQTK